MNRTDLDRFRSTAEEFARAIEGQYGQPLAFDLPSLAVLDAVLSEMLDMAAVYDAVDDRLVASLAYPIVTYVGECLLASLGASWRPAQDDSSLPNLALPNGKLLDLEVPVVTVLRGLASPFFHRLATDLLQTETNGEPQK